MKLSKRIKDLMIDRGELYEDFKECVKSLAMEITELYHDVKSLKDKVKVLEEKAKEKK